MSVSKQKSGARSSGKRPAEIINRFRSSKLEDEISCLKQELKAITSRLEIRGLEPDEIARLGESYNDITIALEALIKEWEEFKSV